VAVDALGGDYGPAVVVEGAVLASREMPVSISLANPEASLRDELARLGATGSINLLDAPDSVGINEKMSLSTLKKHSSIQIAVEQIRDKKTDAFFSANNTAAC
jgi:glycerol-3-phosphate acyltransferase PlsX